MHFSHHHNKAREQMKSVIHLWKRDKTAQELCQINNIDIEELKRWSKIALHGAIDALRTNGIKKVILQ